MLGGLIRRERVRRKMSQQALCHGICAVSYLSKIERETVMCGEEIYRQLLARLGVDYVEEGELTRRLDEEYQGFLRSLEEEGYGRIRQLAQGISPLCQSLRCSSRWLEAALLQALRERLAEEGAQGQPAFAPGQELPAPADGDATRLYRVIQALDAQRARDLEGAAQTLASIRDARHPWTAQAVGLYHFRSGRYGQARDALEEAYEGFARQGAVTGMLDTAVTLSAAEANGQNHQSMLRWIQVARRMNRVVKDRGLEGVLTYNLGASCLMRGELEEGIRQLQNCEALLERQGEQGEALYRLTQQKLAFALAFHHRPDQASRHLERLTLHRPDGYLERAVQAARYMVAHPDFLRQEQFLRLLEECYRHARQQEDRGFSQFYVYYLLETYRAQRQYRKAGELLEQSIFQREHDNTN